MTAMKHSRHLPDEPLVRILRGQIQTLSRLGDALALAVDDYLNSPADYSADEPMGAALDAWNRKPL